MTNQSLKNKPGTFLCKFCVFIILSLTHNRCQKTCAGEREEKAPVRQVFPVSFVSFHIMFPLFLCVSALLQSSSIFPFFHFTLSLCLMFSSLIFPVCHPPLCFGDRHSSIGAFVPAGLAQAQMASEIPGHCAAARYSYASPLTAPVGPEPPGSTTKGDQCP